MKDENGVEFKPSIISVPMNTDNWTCRCGRENPFHSPTCLICGQERVATPTPQETPTPRTDAEIHRLCDAYFYSPANAYSQLCDFARTLERELAQLRRERDETQAAIAQITPLKNSDIRLVIRLSSELAEAKEELHQKDNIAVDLAEDANITRRQAAERIAALRADKERLDWLEENVSPYWPYGNTVEYEFTTKSAAPFTVLPTLRRAIDAARAAIDAARAAQPRKEGDEPCPQATTQMTASTGSNAASSTPSDPDAGAATPETDAEATKHGAHLSNGCVPSAFARKLERQRDALRADKERLLEARNCLDWWIGASARNETVRVYEIVSGWACEVKYLNGQVERFTNTESPIAAIDAARAALQPRKES